MTRIKNVNSTLRKIADECPDLVFGKFLKGKFRNRKRKKAIFSLAVDKGAGYWRGSGKVEADLAMEKLILRRTTYD